MKKFTFTQLASLLFIILFAASCGSNKTFSSRKYTAGNYISHKHKPAKVKVNETVNEEPVYASTKEELTEKDLTSKKALSPEEEKIYASPKSSTETPVKKERFAALKSTKKKMDTFTEKFTLKKRMGKKGKRCNAYSTDSGDGVEPTALVGFILSVVGLAVNIFALTMTVGASEYIFTLLFIVGMVLGIIGLVFGTQGLRKHHKEGGSNLDLVFSILGTALGGAAILTAFVFSIYTFFFWLAGI
ncbi:MAG: hypothetical protein V4506_05715 [Bacteroidota bacterium]